MKRIRGVKPTLKQAKIMQKNNMNPDDWLVQKVFPDFIVCIHKHVGTVKSAYVEALKI